MTKPDQKGKMPYTPPGYSWQDDPDAGVYKDLAIVLAKATGTEPRAKVTDTTISSLDQDLIQATLLRKR